MRAELRRRRREEIAGPEGVEGRGEEEGRSRMKNEKGVVREEGRENKGREWAARGRGKRKERRRGWAARRGRKEESAGQDLVEGAPT